MFGLQLPTPPALVAAAAQGLEKAELSSTKPVLTMQSVVPDTYGVVLDVALQVGEQTTEAIRRLLDASAAAAADDAVLAALDAAATDVADLDAAVHVVRDYPGQPFVITPAATADLRASGYGSWSTPAAQAPSSSPPTGVSLVVIGPASMEGLVPARGRA